MARLAISGMAAAALASKFNKAAVKAKMGNLFKLMMAKNIFRFYQAGVAKTRAQIRAILAQFMQGNRMKDTIA